MNWTDIGFTALILGALFVAGECFLEWFNSDADEEPDEWDDPHGR